MQYMVLPTDDDIQHRYHKYVDRKRGKNGKWVYIYPNDKKKSNTISKKDSEKKNGVTAAKVAAAALHAGTSSGIGRLIDIAKYGFKIADLAEQYKTEKDIDDRIKELDDKIKDSNGGFHYIWDSDGSLADVERVDTLEKEKENLLKLKEKRNKENMKHNYIVGNGYIIAPVRYEKPNKKGR